MHTHDNGPLVNYFVLAESVSED